MWGKACKTFKCNVSFDLQRRRCVRPLVYISHISSCHDHIQTFPPEKKDWGWVWADQSFCNGLNFLGFFCCLLFCVGGNPIGGLHKSQNKCFQMMMSCPRKKKAERKSRKEFQQPNSLKKQLIFFKSHRELMLISCWHKANPAVRWHYALHLWITLALCNTGEKPLKSLVNFSKISGNQSESRV